MPFVAREVAGYLSQKLGKPVDVKKLSQSFPGVSRETWFAFAEVAGVEQGFVVRVDPPEGGSCVHSLETEWEIYRRLYESKQVPVAEPLWFDPGPDFSQGRPLMVRRLVDGKSTIDGLNDDTPAAADLRKRVAYECVEKLAQVHMMDWKAAKLDEVLKAPPSAAESFKFEMAEWQRTWDEGQSYADPVLDEVLYWLSENIPTDTPRISLAKGNNGVGEEIWKDGKIIAMSDWELACLGDGVSDLFWSQGTIRLIGFDEALRHYERCMGHAVSPERLAYANLFALVKQVICSVVYWYGHVPAGRTKRIYAVSGLTYTADTRRRLGLCIGKSLTEAWSIVSQNEKSMYTKVGGNTL